MLVDAQLHYSCYLLIFENSRRRISYNESYTYIISYMFLALLAY
jgi:hypothetical protein